MKNIILIGCLLGSLFILSAAPEASSTLSIEDMHYSSFQPVIETALLTADDIPAQAVKNVSLQTVNHLSLDDDPSAVLEKKGEPERISRDPVLDEYDIYEYSDMSVAFRDGIIEFVEISGDVATIRLDETVLPATLDAVKEALGEPDYEAEDGYVFQRDEALLKLFIDEATGELLSISYYHIASV